MNILFLGSIHSVHDIKYASFFAADPAFKIYFLDGSDNHISPERKKWIEDKNIRLLQPIPLFSIKNLFRTLKYGIRLRKMIKENEIDLVHILLATPNALWALVINTPAILTTRGSDVLVTLENIKKEAQRFNIKQFILLKLFVASLNRFKYYTGTSSAQLKKLSEYVNISEGKVFKIRTGIDIKAVQQTDATEVFSEDLVGGKKIIFFPRIFTPTYNHELEIEAIKKLPESVRVECIFVFVKGIEIDTEYAIKLKDAILNLREVTCKVYDLLTQKEMWALYKKATLTVMVPESDGTPNSALEAMAVGCPLILGSYEYDEDLFKGTCLKLEKDDPQEMARLIVKALTDYPDALKKKAHEQLKLHGDRQTEMNKLKRIYHQAVKEQV